MTKAEREALKAEFIAEKIESIAHSNECVRAYHALRGAVVG